MLKKSFFITILLFFLFSTQNNIIAQDIDEYEKKFYTDSTGRLFVNKEVPLYIKVSNSEDINSSKFLLKDSAKNKAIPFYFSKEGKNIIYTPWVTDPKTKKIIEPKQLLEFEVYADGLAPISKISNNSIAYNKSGELIFGTNLIITITVKERGSGVYKTMYSTNKSEFKEYIEPISFNTEGKYTFSFFSVDNVGNVEKIRHQEFSIDGSKPLTNIQFEGEKFGNNIFSGHSKINLQPEDAFSGSLKTYYILDNNKKKIYSSPINTQKMSEGKHAITYYSVDNVNNEEEKQTYEFYVDKSAPIIVDEIEGDSYFVDGKEYLSGRSRVKLTAVDNKSGVKNIFYSLNGSPFSEYTKPFFLPKNKGKISIKFYAVDNVNNKTNISSGDFSNSHKFSYMDNEPPKMSYKFIGKIYSFNNNIYISSQTQLKINASDKESGLNKIIYEINNNKQQIDYQQPITFEKFGENKIDMYAYDNVNNFTENSSSFFVDNKKPKISLFFSCKNLGNTQINNNDYITYPQELIIFINCFDEDTNIKEIYYSINNNAYKKYNGLLRNFSSGKNKISVKAIDMLGNEAIENFEIYVK